MLPKAARSAVAIVLLGVLAACDPSLELHVEPGSSSTNLVLHAFQNPDSVGSGAMLSRLEIRLCADTGYRQPPSWHIEREPRAPRAAPVRFTFGTPTINGWRTIQAAAPLEVNRCYVASLSGGGIGATLFFAVDSSGRVNPSRDAWNVTEAIAELERGVRPAH
jgi:hypothetical protein